MTKPEDVNDSGSSDCSAAESPILGDFRNKMKHFGPEFSISEVACIETEGMREWWESVDESLNQGKRIRLAIVDVD